MTRCASSRGRGPVVGRFGSPVRDPVVSKPCGLRSVAMAIVQAQAELDFTASDFYTYYSYEFLVVNFTCLSFRIYTGIVL